MTDGSRLSRRGLAAVLLPASLAPLNSTMIAVAIPNIGDATGASSGTLRQALVTSYLLASICLQGPGGKCGDRFGHRNAFNIGQALLAIGALSAWVWPTLIGLSIGRVVMACGAAIVLPGATAVLRTEVPRESRGRAFGTLGAVMGLSAALGPPLGATLVEHFGWPSVFLANLPILGTALALAPPRKGLAIGALNKQPFDFLGSALLGLSLFGIAAGIEHSDVRWAAWIGLGGLVLFARWEKHATDPVVDLSLFSHRAFLGGAAIIALQSLALYATMFELPQVAGRLFEVGTREMGGSLLAMTGTMVATSPFAGRFTDKVGARRVALCGCGLALVAMLSQLAAPFTSFGNALMPLAGLGAGMGLASAPAQAAAMNAISSDRSGMAAGVLATMRYVGSMAGLTLLGAVLTDTRIEHVVRREHTVSLGLFAVALGLSVLCAFLLPTRGDVSRTTERVS
jgi:MFS family permease